METLDTINSSAGTESSAPEPEAPTSDGQGEQETGTDTSETAEDDTPDESAEPEEQTQEDAEQSEEAVQTTVPDKKTAIEGLIQQFAKETGLNPADPAQRKILRRLAEKEYRIQELTAAGKQTAQPQSEMTEMDRLLTEEDQADPNAQTTTTDKSQAQPEAAQTALYGDVGDSWTKPEDAYTALSAAWKAGDLSKVKEVENAMFTRRLDWHLQNVVFPAIEQRLQAFAEKDLGDVLPAVRQSVQQTRSKSNQDYAVTSLAKVPGFEGINAMFDADQDTPISIDGVQFANSPFNRAVKANPSILRIRVDASDPDAQKLARKMNIRPEDAAERLTFQETYRAALAYLKAGQIDPGKAKQLMAAGAEQTQRAAKDRIRQGLNSGTPATKSGASQRPASDRPQSLEDL